MISPLPEKLEHRRIRTNGVDLHVVLAGPEEGPLVILLHGFPELWYGWRNQIAPLAEAGFRVVAPDQRGYNLSDKPRGLAAYTRDVLAADVVGLIDALGAEKAILVAHDWGGAVAWWTALQHSERVARLVALNIPHPIAMARALRGSEQIRRSWYIGFFQLPWLPERLLSRRDYSPLLSLLKKSCRPGAVTAEDLEVYRESFGQPGALEGMLSWYRAILQRRSLPLRNRKVRAPTLVIWGKQDKALGWQMAQPSVDLCHDGRLELIGDAGHFPTHDAPGRVNHLILGFLSSPSQEDFVDCIGHRGQGND